MSNQKEIVLSGVGGQGLIVCGTLLGEAAVLFGGKRAVLSSEYGVETRGTFAKSDLIVSDEEIYFPESIAPGLVLCLHQIAYQRYAGKLDKGTMLIYNSDEVIPDSSMENQKGYALTSLARELGNLSTLNIISLGLVVAYTGIVSPNEAKQELAQYWSKKGQKVVDLNLKAFDIGYALK